MRRKSKYESTEYKLQQLVKAKKEQWDEFYKHPDFYSIQFILKQQNLFAERFSELFKERENPLTPPANGTRKIDGVFTA